MQPNPNSTGRSALASASHSKSYDPSEQLRARMMPPAPVYYEMPPNDPYSSNPVLLQEDPTVNNQQKKDRIPTFYYPRYNDGDGPRPANTYARDLKQSNATLPPPPPVIQQPIPLSMEPYGADQYYPYGTPYIIPVPNNMPQVDPSQSMQELSRADILAPHQKDADLSRLEVYHFTPKQNTSLSMGTNPALPGQPLVQYHVYPFPPGPQPPQQQPYPPYAPPWYGYPPYASESGQPMLPLVETKARGSQTEQTSTKSRGVSPMYFPAAPVYDNEGYPYVYHTTAHTDRYVIPTGRINQRFYDNKSSTPLADCRCLDCQRERGKVLNYYPN
jgi:hypothetical protein